MEKRLQMIGKYGGATFSALGGLAVIAKMSLFTVNGGFRAVIWDRFRGVLPEVRGEGLHFQIPLIQKPFFYEVRTRPVEIRTDTGTKDMQTVNLILRVLYKPMPEKLPIIHKEIGPDYDDRILPSIGNEVLKSVVALYDAGELITQREMISTKIRENLTVRAADFNISVEDVSMTHLSFSSEFSGAIEAKQVAQQEAERSKFVVAKAEQEKKAAIIRASGEAEAAKLIGVAMEAGTGFIELRKIEASRDIADILSRSRNVTYIPQSGGMFLNLPAGGPRPPRQ